MNQSKDDISINKFRIVCDTREQTPWHFNASKYCLGTTISKVNHGDYTIEGLEDKIFLERKASAAEIAHNVFEKRFDKLLLESEKYKYRYIICEFPLSHLVDYPHGSGLPKSVIRKIRVSGALLLSKIFDYQINHGINIVFCDNNLYAKQFVLSLFKKIHKIEGLS